PTAAADRRESGKPRYYDEALQRNYDEALKRSRGAESQAMLLLSGGGPEGAFGAGLLYGLQEVNSYHAYDVVTGVSTGAMQATLAFLAKTEGLYGREIKVPEGTPYTPGKSNLEDLAAAYSISRE